MKINLDKLHDLSINLLRHLEEKEETTALFMTDCTKRLQKRVLEEKIYTALIKTEGLKNAHFSLTTKKLKVYEDLFILLLRMNFVNSCLKIQIDNEICNIRKSEKKKKWKIALFTLK